jgi:hypothetical protein
MSLVPPFPTKTNRFHHRAAMNERSLVPLQARPRLALDGDALAARVPYNYYSGWHDPFRELCARAVQANPLPLRLTSSSSKTGIAGSIAKNR